jgi:hypothetical protein
MAPARPRNRRRSRGPASRAPRPRRSWRWTSPGPSPHRRAPAHPPRHRHTGRRARIPATTTHPTHAWVTQAARTLLTDLKDAGNLPQARFLIHDRDATYPALTGKIPSGATITTVPAGARMPRMNPITERWVNTLRAELPDRTLIWNQTHLQHALHDYGRRCNLHRTHRAPAAAAPPGSCPTKPTESNASPYADTTASAE